MSKIHKVSVSHKVHNDALTPYIWCLEKIGPHDEKWYCIQYVNRDIYCFSNLSDYTEFALTWGFK